MSNDVDVLYGLLKSFLDSCSMWMKSGVFSQPGPHFTSVCDVGVVTLQLKNNTTTFHMHLYHKSSYKSHCSHHIIFCFSQLPVTIQYEKLATVNVLHIQLLTRYSPAIAIDS